MSSNDLMTLPEGFRKRFEVCEKTGCWVWTGATWGTPKLQYGKFWLDRAHRQSHRVSYNLLIDPDFVISPGLGTDQQLDHVHGVCATGSRCVNPWHLEPVTNRENGTRSIRGNRSHTSSRYTGVTKHKSGSWQAQIRHNGQSLYIGLWVSPLRAAHAYDAACILIGAPPSNFDRGLTSRLPSSPEIEHARGRFPKAVAA